MTPGYQLQHLVRLMNTMTHTKDVHAIKKIKESVMHQMKRVIKGCGEDVSTLCLEKED